MKLHTRRLNPQARCQPRGFAQANPMGSILPTSIQEFMDLWSEPSTQQEFRLGTTEIRPLMELYENSFALVLRVELPGFQEKDLQLEIIKNTLTLTGELKLAQDEDLKAVHVAERRYGKLCRSMLLPAEVMADKMTASLKNGILEVQMPKVNPEQLARQIPIEIEAGPEESDE